MRILGIDPGYAILGYGIVDIVGNKFSVVDYGAITTDPSMDMPSRLVKLFDGLTELISAFKPDEASIEELFFNSNAKTAILVGEARGVAVLACAKGNLKINEYTPLQIKQAMVGYADYLASCFPKISDMLNDRSIQFLSRTHKWNSRRIRDYRHGTHSTHRFENFALQLPVGAFSV